MNNYVELNNWREVGAVVSIIGAHLPVGVEVIKVAVKRSKEYYSGRKMSYIEVIWANLVPPKKYHGENKNRSVFRSVHNLTRFTKKE